MMDVASPRIKRPDPRRVALDAAMLTNNRKRALRECAGSEAVEDQPRGRAGPGVDIDRDGSSEKSTIGSRSDWLHCYTASVYQCWSAEPASATGCRRPDSDHPQRETSISPSVDQCREAARRVRPLPPLPRPPPRPLRPPPCPLRRPESFGLRLARPPRAPPSIQLRQAGLSQSPVVAISWCVPLSACDPLSTCRTSPACRALDSQVGVADSSRNVTRDRSIAAQKRSPVTSAYTPTTVRGLVGKQPMA